MADLLDASVWLPLSAPDHVHHARARRYWEEEAAPRVAFCRVTMLALLRHLSDPRVMGRAAVDGTAAWRGVQRWLELPEVVLLDEPSGVEALLNAWSTELNIRAGNWTDAYLAAFARRTQSRLVAFDADFRRYPRLDLLQLSP